MAFARMMLDRVSFHRAFLIRALKQRGTLVPVPRKTLVRMGLVYAVFLSSMVLQGVQSTSHDPRVVAEAGLGQMTAVQAALYVGFVIIVGSLAWPTAALAAVRGRNVWGWFLLGMSGLGLVLWFQPTDGTGDGSVRDSFDRVVDALAFRSRRRRTGLAKIAIGTLGIGGCFGMITAIRDRGFIYVSGWFLMVPLGLIFMYGVAQYLFDLEG